MKKFIAVLVIILLCGQLGLASCEGLPATLDEPALEHYLLLGFDFWGDETIGVSYSDTNILATVDKTNGRLMITSLLRDSYVQYPDGKWGRLNSVVKEYGYDAMLETIALNYQVSAQHYMAIGVHGLQRLIDALGGVEVTLTAAEADKLSSISGISGAGTYSLSGHGAVMYMRIRHLSGSDFSRTERQRKVLSQIYKQMQHMTLEQALELVQVLYEEVDTNMSLSDMIQAASSVYALRGGELEMLSLPVTGTYKSSTIHEMAVLELDWEANRLALHNFLYSEGQE